MNAVRERGNANEMNMKKKKQQMKKKNKKRTFSRQYYVQRAKAPLFFNRIYAHTHR